MVRSNREQEERHPSLKEIARRAASEAEWQAIRLALEATRGNKSEAARLLRVDYKTLHLKMKATSLTPESFACGDAGVDHRLEHCAPVPESPPPLW
jgi:DNA-binding NtrC family response regulator